MLRAAGGILRACGAGTAGITASAGCSCAYLALIGTFAAILMAPNLAVLVLAQIVFGCVVGLIYYSSLFYSMDLGDTKGEHGGIHEAAIGLGNFAGPAVGAASLYFPPAIRQQRGARRQRPAAPRPGRPAGHLAAGDVSPAARTPSQHPASTRLSQP